MGNQGTNKYISAEVPPDRRGVITGVKQSGVMFGVFMAGVWLPRLPSSIRWLAIYAALMGGAVGCQSAFLALYAEEELGLSRSQAFSPILMFISLGAVGSFVLIRLAAEFGAWMIFATPLVAGFTTNSWNTPVMLASMRLVPAGAAGRSAGLVMLGFMTGYAIVPPLFGAAVDRLGSYDVPWLAGIFFCLAAAAVAALWRRTELGSSEQEIVEIRSS